MTLKYNQSLTDIGDLDRLSRISSRLWLLLPLDLLRGALLMLLLILLLLLREYLEYEEYDRDRLRDLVRERDGV